ncbi:hypothetical protein FRB97_002180 [Tulasnella sp. 331]|nr:hypothetical protein FRB97_002180 [Tulasnella sp. 331]
MAIRPVDFIISTVTKFFVAHAASPRPDRWKDWIKYEGVKMFYIKPTTIEELQLGIQLQDHGDRPTADQVRRFFSRCGPSARDAYLNATDPSDYEVDPTEKVRALVSGQLVVLSPIRLDFPSPQKSMSFSSFNPISTLGPAILCPSPPEPQWRSFVNTKTQNGKCLS